MCNKLGENQDEGEALAKVYKIIIKLSPQVPISQRGNAHRIEFLRNAVVGYVWATEPLSRIASQGLSFQQLYGELEAALQLSKEAKIAAMRDRMESRRSQADQDEPNIVGILYTGQGKYAFRNKGRSKRVSPKKNDKGVNPLSIMGCFNCGDPSHMLKDCSKEVNLMRAAKSRLEYAETKTGTKRNAHNVLFALYQHLAETMDESSGTTDEEKEDDNTTDQELFSTLLAEVESEERTEVMGEEKIHLVNMDINFYMLNNAKKEFLGACLDTAASMSLVGREQAEEYCKMIGILLAIEERIGRTFKFGSQKKASLGAAKFWIPYGGNQMMETYLDVVDISIALLLGLNRLNEHKLYINNIEEVSVRVEPKWSHPITRKSAHLFYEWTKDVFYTDNELKRIHRHFYHPHPD